MYCSVDSWLSEILVSILQIFCTDKCRSSCLIKLWVEKRYWRKQNVFFNLPKQSQNFVDRQHVTFIWNLLTINRTMQLSQNCITYAWTKIADYANFWSLYWPQFVYFKPAYVVKYSCLVYANKVTFPVHTKVVVFWDIKYLMLVKKNRLTFHAVTSLKSCKISSSTGFVYIVPKKSLSLFSLI